MDYLDEVRKNLDLSSAECEQVMREIEGHYDATIAELRSNGVDAANMAAEVRKVLGDPADVARRIHAVHYASTWKNALLCALPFLGALFLPQVWGNMPHGPVRGLLMLIGLAYGSSLILGSVRELIHNRRPVWLATWLPAAMAMSATWVNQSYTEKLSWFVMADKVGTPYQALSIVHSHWGDLLLLLPLYVLSVWALPSAKARRLVTGLALASLAYLFIYLRMLGSNTTLGIVAAAIMNWQSTLAMVLSVAAAIGVFSRHRYGNIAQASLFLFALAAFPEIAGFARSSLWHSPPTWIICALYVSAIALAAGATVTSLARASTLYLKRAYLVLGLLLVGAVKSVLHETLFGMDPSTAAFNHLLIWVPIQILLVVIVPWLVQRKLTGRRPEIAG